jgi:hypothetical protein
LFQFVAFADQHGFVGIQRGCKDQMNHMSKRDDLNGVMLRGANSMMLTKVRLMLIKYSKEQKHLHNEFVWGFGINQEDIKLVVAAK